MKETPLTNTHIGLGAKMTEFAGYTMPVYYNSISEEHLWVRNHVGVFDVAHMGEFIVKGKEALSLVQKISTNDASRLSIGQAQYSCIPNETGGIVDDILVYRLPEDQCAEGEMAFLLVVNASNIEKDFEWIKKYNTFDTQLINISEKTGLLAVQGPEAAELLQQYCSEPLSEIDYYHFIKTQFGDLENVMVSATGYTGSGGFELYVNSEQLMQLWEMVFEDPRNRVRPIGLGARDTLRLEMGYCLYGNDIDDSTSPLEAGLGWVTKTNKQTDFPGKDIFIEQKANGVSKKLMGFVLEGKRVPRNGYPILNTKGENIGTVTSGTMSPNLNKPIGMGYIQSNVAQVGNSIMIDIRNKPFEATIVKPPFYNPPKSMFKFS